MLIDVCQIVTWQNNFRDMLRDIAVLAPSASAQIRTSDIFIIIDSCQLHATTILLFVLLSSSMFFVVCSLTANQSSNCTVAVDGSNTVYTIDRDYLWVVRYYMNLIDFIDDWMLMMMIIIAFYGCNR